MIVVGFVFIFGGVKLVDMSKIFVEVEKKIDVELYRESVKFSTLKYEKKVYIFVFKI